jgi:hypothetical protein
MCGNTLLVGHLQAEQPEMDLGTNIANTPAGLKYTLDRSVENSLQSDANMLLVAIILIASVTVFVILWAHRTGDLREMEEKYFKRRDRH